MRPADDSATRDRKPARMRPAVIVGAGVLLLSVINGPAARGTVERFLSERLHRPVRIAGGLRLHLLAVAPEADLYDLRVGQPAWAGPGDMVRIAHLHVAMPWSALTGGALRFDALDLDRPVVSLLRQPSGRANWTFDAGTEPGVPLHLPFIRELTIRDGRLRLDDQPREAAFAGSVSTDRDGALRLRAAGEMKHAPFSLVLDGASLARLRADRPYVLSGAVRAGTTALRMRATLARPFDFARVSGEVAASGDTLHGLADVIGVPLPNTPRYALTVRLSRDGSRYAFEDLRGRVAGSDVHGSFRLDTANGRRRLTGALRSDHLRLGDLLAVIGGESGAPDAVAARRAAARPGPRRFLSDGALKPSWFRALDTRIGFASDDVQAGRLPLRRLSFSATLDRGVLTLRPIRMTFARGLLEGALRLDARRDLPASDLTARFTGFRAEDVLAVLRAPPALSGPLEGRLHLQGRGLSLHRTAAAASGGAWFAMGPGQARRSYSRLLGGDVVGGVLALRDEDASGTPLRCAAAGLRVSGGRAALALLSFDTAAAVVDGGGSVDLATESLTVRLVGRSKRAQVLHVPAPATIAGPWGRPRVSIDKGQLVRAGAAGLVSTVLSPLKALPPGLGPRPAADLDCGGLAARAAASAGMAVSAPRAGRAGRG